MSEIDRIADQLRRAYEGEAWHGPSLREILAGITVEQADATSLSHPDASFDVVIAMLVWHHVGVWQEATAEARRVLRSGGLLVLADVLDPWHLLHGFGTYTLRELQETFASSGFRRWKLDVGPRPWYRLVAEAP